MGGSIDLDAPGADATRGAAPADLVPDPAEDVESHSAKRRLMPSAAGLDRLAYRIIALAFPIWTFAVIAGAIWAQEAWGRYWGWDPKETWSFITWVVFAGYLHARATSGWKGRRAAVIALVGLRVAARHVLRREPLDRGAPQLCEVRRRSAGEPLDPAVWQPSTPVIQCARSGPGTPATPRRRRSHEPDGSETDRAEEGAVDPRPRGPGAPALGVLLRGHARTRCSPSARSRSSRRRCSCPCSGSPWASS